MAYVYRHIRLDKNTPFYIGISNDNNYKRAYTDKSRNIYWQNIVNFTDYKVDILIDEISWEEACEKEKEFIALYGKNTNGGYLCNISDGGGGGFLSEEVNEKRSQSLMGHKLSEETKIKIGLKATGRKASVETKEKMSLSHKGKPLTWLDPKGHNNSRAFKVYQYSMNNEFIKEWECAIYATKFYNMNRTSITDCLKGRQKSAKGFIWKKYRDDL
jgi:hypothetical protein